MEDVGEECFEKELPRGQPFDDTHRCPAAGARPRRPWCGRGERFVRRRRDDRERLTTLRELACPTARGEEAKVADADKALRQDVQKKPSQEFVDVEGQRAYLAPVPIILP